MKTQTINRFLAATVAALAFTACATTTEDDATLTDDEQASIAWELGMNDDDREQVCAALTLLGEDGFKDEMTSGTDAVTDDVADAFIELLEDKC